MAADDCRFVFAGGGTGGHLYPGLAVADAVRRRRPDAEITFLTTSRELDAQLLSGTPFERVPQNVRPFTLHPLRVISFLRAWRSSVAAARELIRRRRPRAVLGLGGYAAGPAVVAARREGIPAAILNPDAIPGRANRRLSREASLVVLQWEVSRRHFPTGTHCEVLGCPIRRGFAQADRAASRAAFGLDAARPTLLVTGASQGARTVNEAMMRVWPEFAAAHPEWQLLHLSGSADETAVRAAYAARGAAAVVRAFTEEMPTAIAAADIVISRAGASTLAELTAVGRASILLPYPYHRDRHQHANAAVLVDAGAARLVEDARDAAINAPAILSELESLRSAAVREPMARAAVALGRAGAAEATADWLLGSPGNRRRPGRSA